jgi:hypothetical protein
MAETDTRDMEKGDEVLRRLLKTPPAPKAKPDTKKRRAETRRLPVLKEDRENSRDAE